MNEMLRLSVEMGFSRKHFMQLSIEMWSFQQVTFNTFNVYVKVIKEMVQELDVVLALT